MLELTTEQVAGLAEIDERGFVERVRQDLVKEYPAFADDGGLSSRLWAAYRAARAFGIEQDENIVAFLRLEAYAPSFYEKPATKAWLTRPGRSADARFHDYLRVIKWRIEHPDGGLEHGDIGVDALGSGDNGAWSRLGARWRRLVGRSDGGGNGEFVG
ncbi:MULTISPECIES: hypothetical protein [pseudomallei group]|uniref:hypothetical protein n=1 Tax=pseudomallei group TaxID=111527 RepID=UPI0013770AB7|nr:MULTISPECIES: hypothetical protein [pseudomallei group]MCS3401050.1 hypothetical protein [Burkholderia thailandensis]MCV9914858.1 hypothetical protein [Burkholderia pseudomallei]MCW0071125.1 hypothetical protein [Burkholderia pseudomallei]MDW9240101.1 hypothetical protein [Burkholderia thailandensis]MUV28210.1 hypothetical protein [Burkholderia thailandensis]